jgi:gamma-glutamylcyclotransferase (GGCT)/AIG2-like uncharacterized protein YtfP
MKYFAYGSNMSREELRAWCPSAEFVTIARLPNHRLDFTRHSRRRQGGVADVVPSNGDEVWGVVYDIPSDELPALDRKEGVPNAYQREYVSVIVQSGERAEALTYTVVHKVPTELPSERYLDLILKGAREWKLPAEYVRKLEQTERRRGGD